MKNFIIVTFIFLSASLAQARPDGHAPIGVMDDHTHGADGWMASYRYMVMSMEDLASGTDSISDQAVRHQGYTLVPTQMDMQMHMIGLMYAPTDRITLKAMTQYVIKDMDMVGTSTLHGHGHQPAPHSMPRSMVHNHETEGWGDTVVGALVSFWETDSQSAHFGLGLGLPTAEVEEKQGAIFQPYGMQLGNGVWDFQPSLTYRGFAEVWSWGGQASARLNLEDENDAGFAYGDQVGLTAWGARKITDTASFSGRLKVGHQDAIEGHYNGPHGHEAPPHRPGNYGGDVIEVGAGINLLGQSGVLAGHRLAVEAVLPVYQEVNGIQLEREVSLTVGWQKAF